MHTTEVTRRPAAGKVILAALLAAAAALRLWHLNQGLPDFLEEAIPLRMAMGLRSPGGSVDFNPHSFNYPTLALYLHFAVQQIVHGVATLAGVRHGWADTLLAFALDPTPMVVASRLIGVVCDLVVIAAVVSIGERLVRGAGWIAAVTIALAPTPITIARSIFTDSLLAAFAVLAVERLMAWNESSRRRDLVLAFVCIGLASGAKYPGAILLLPALLLVGWRLRGRAPMVCLVGGAIAAAAFVATTPYALLDFATFVRDFRFESGHAAVGHLGSMDHRSAGYHAGLLVTNLGLIGMLLAAATPLLAWRTPRLRAPVAVLLAAFVCFFAPIALARIDAERYILPVLPLAALLAGIGMALVFVRAGRPVRLAVAGVCALSFALVAGAGFGVAANGADTTQGRAREWIEHSLDPGDVIVQEGYGATLTSALKVQELMSGPVYAHASPAARERVRNLRTYTTVSVPLWVAGAMTVPLRNQSGAEVEIEVAPHASLVSGAFYRPELYAQADWFVTSAAVSDRYRRDPARYPAQCAFYDFLRDHATAVATFPSSARVTGATLTVYRIDDAYRHALAGGLPTAWWRAAVPASYPGSVRRALRASSDDASVAQAAEAGLAAFYRLQVNPFVSDLALSYATAHRDTMVLQLTRATLAVLPLDEFATQLDCASAARLGRWNDVIANGERMEHALGRDAVPPGVALMAARALHHTGRNGAARTQLQELLRRLPASDPVAAAARKELYLTTDTLLVSIDEPRVSRTR